MIPYPILQASTYTVQPTLRFTLVPATAPASAQTLQADLSAAVASAAAALAHPSAVITTAVDSGGGTYTVSVLFPTADMVGAWALE